jgi:hypothetical protein
MIKLSKSEVVMGAKRVKCSFLMIISPGKRPSHGIFPEQTIRTPSTIRIKPKKMSVFPSPNIK